jgi:mercuric ion transport protein
MTQKSSTFSIAGGLLAAVGASICCAGPLVLLLLGISGSWISNLTLFEPYKPLFILATLVMFGWAGWKIYRPVRACETGTPCADTAIQKRRKWIFWITAVMALILVSSSYWILWFVQ